MKERHRRPRILIIALLAAGSASCSGEGVIKHPLVRVDLSSGWSRQVKLRALAAIPLECKKTVALAASGVNPRFRVAWRVADFGESRRIAAVEVGPEGDGRVAGVRNFAASAGVGVPTNRGTEERVMTTVPVQVGWSGETGCASIGRSESVLLRADDPSCVAPKQPKLLRPVK